MSGSANAAPASQFVVENGSISAATGTPMPTSGTHASLWSDTSVATTTIQGAGRVVIRAMGQGCKGMPVVRVTVNGTVVGTAKLTSATTYRQFVLGRSFPQGTHQVRIAMTNDRSDSQTCDRNAFISSASMQRPTGAQPPPPPPPPPPPTGQPGPSNTGVPDGTVLQHHYGNLTITTPGTVVNAMDIHGFLTIRASNVTVQNSIVRGGDPGQVNSSLISAYGDHVNLVIKDTTLVGAFPSPYLDGLKGLNFTATRLDISNVVDTILIFGDNVTVQDSWLHGNTHFDPDPRTPDGISHDDNVQIEGGRNIMLRHNTFQGAYGAVVMITQNYARSQDISIIDNVISGGGCSINLSEKGQGPIQNTLVQDNEFGATRVNGCAVIAPPTSPVRMVNNIWSATGASVGVTRGA